MRAAGHIAGGVGLLVVAAFLFWRAWMAQRSWTYQSDHWLARFARFGNTRRQWLWRLRASNAVMGLILLVFAASLWVTA